MGNIMFKCSSKNQSSLNKERYLGRPSSQSTNEERKNPQIVVETDNLSVGKIIPDNLCEEDKDNSSKWPTVHSNFSTDYDYTELESAEAMLKNLDEEIESPAQTYDVTVNPMCITRQFATKRLKEDMVELWNEAPHGITAIPMEDDIFLWKISILGPENSPFEGRVIQGILQFSGEYPYFPPTLAFTPMVFHPNVTEDGDLCLSEIHKHWTPCYSLSSFLTSVKYLLAEPSTFNPANEFAANAFNNSPIIYEEMARMSGLQHKSSPKIPEEVV